MSETIGILGNARSMSPTGTGNDPPPQNGLCATTDSYNRCSEKKEPIETRILRQRTKVQVLAYKLHQAKASKGGLDWHKYSWLGLDKQVIAENWNEKHPMHPELKEALERYKNARKNYWQAKKELDRLIEEQDLQTYIKKSETAITQARERMKKTLIPTLRKAVESSMQGGDGGFELSNHPKLIKKIDDNVDKEIQEMRKNPSEATVLSLVETLAAATEAGYDTVRPAQNIAAMEAAKQIAKKMFEESDKVAQKLIKDMDEKTKKGKMTKAQLDALLKSNQPQLKRWIGRKALYQHLGGGN